VGCVEAPGAELSPCKAGRSGQTPGRLSPKLPISAHVRLGRCQSSGWIHSGDSPSSPEASRARVDCSSPEPESVRGSRRSGRFMVSRHDRLPGPSAVGIDTETPVDRSSWYGPLAGIGPKRRSPMSPTSHCWPVPNLKVRALIHSKDLKIEDVQLPLLCDYGQVGRVLTR
jgi:hypothetical protein